MFIAELSHGNWKVHTAPLGERLPRRRNNIGTRFSSHMADEEHVLLDVLSSPLRSRLLDEHDSLRAQFRSLDNTLDLGRALALDDLASLAATSQAHIQWEERVLFSYIQSQASPNELQSPGDRLHSRRASDAASCGLPTDRHLLGRETKS